MVKSARRLVQIVPEECGLQFVDSALFAARARNVYRTVVLLDTSAIVCAILREPGHERLKDLLNRARVIAVGTPMMLEAGMVLSGRGIEARAELPAFLEMLGAEPISFRDEHQRLALSAFLRFGRGRHPAQLNFGDCMSYAFARLSGLPLVYKGDDFGRTDLDLLYRLDAPSVSKG